MGKQKSKELLSLYRKTLTAISQMKLKTIRPQLTADFGLDGFYFCCTVFDVKNENRTLYIFNHVDMDGAKNRVGLLLDVIRKDDFESVVSLLDAMRA